MNPEVKQLWIEALPRYTRGYGCLRENDCYCPLGVLCDLYPQKNWDLYCGETENRHYMMFGTDDVLPEKVAVWAGLDTTDPSLEYDGYTAPIYELNDKEHIPLEELITLIREQL